MCVGILRGEVGPARAFVEQGADSASNLERHSRARQQQGLKLRPRSASADGKMSHICSLCRQASESPAALKMKQSCGFAGGTLARCPFGAVAQNLADANTRSSAVS